MFIVHLSAILIVPELIILTILLFNGLLTILLFNGLEQGSVYYKMRVNKKANLFQHDPAVTNLRGPVAPYLAFRMDEVWNPNGALPIRSEDELLEKETSNVKMLSLSFLLTIVPFISLMIYLYAKWKYVPPGPSPP
jgi:hypothetical protein